MSLRTAASLAKLAGEKDLCHSLALRCAKDLVHSQDWLAAQELLSMQDTLLVSLSVRCFYHFDRNKQTKKNPETFDLHLLRLGSQARVRCV